MSGRPWTPDELALLRTKQPAKTIASQIGRSVAAVWIQQSKYRDEIGYRFPTTCDECDRRHYAQGKCLKHYKRWLRREAGR